MNACVLPSGCGCDLNPNSSEKSGPSQSLWQARGKTGSSSTSRDSKYARIVSSATLDSLRDAKMQRDAECLYKINVYMSNTHSALKPVFTFSLPQSDLQWSLRLEALVRTHMLRWSLMRSYTIRLLLSLAKYMAVFLCLDRMLQSAPYSSRRRTTSAFPLLHACREGQTTFIKENDVPRADTIERKKTKAD